MATALLVIIYLAFISLGLPDSVLGSAWPIMQHDLNASFEQAGIISLFVAGSTIASSLLTSAVVKRFGAGVVTLLSTFLTAGALLGFSAAPSFIWLIILAIPLGLGGGAVDAALNNYVANHYRASHMSWLHSFWGVGATLGPIIMSAYLVDGAWRTGYLTIAIIQFSLVAVLLLSLPLWRRMNRSDSMNNTKDEVAATSRAPLGKHGISLAMSSFLFYCGVEATMGLWGSSFLVNVKQMDAAAAAGWVSTYYGGITLGRFISGFITLRVSSRTLIRVGQILVLIGTLLFLLPLPIACTITGFMLVGIGCAPIFPCMLHETPARFGRERSQKIMGYQMAAAYTGATLLPPLLGWIAGRTTIAIFPYFIAVYALVMLLSSERINQLLAKKPSSGD